MLATIFGVTPRSRHDARRGSGLGPQSPREAIAAALALGPRIVKSKA